jgi:hypothetical protein
VQDLKAVTILAQSINMQATNLAAASTEYLVRARQKELTEEKSGISSTLRRDVRLR